MKTVFRSSEIAHVWFHAQAPHGKSPGAMSFQGDVFLSYNTAIARKVTHKGQVAVILNDRSFSNTTHKHMGIVRRALPDSVTVPRFHFDDGMGTRLDVSPTQLFDYAIKCATNALTNSQRPRLQQKTRDAYLASRQLWLSEAQKVSDFFGLRRKVDDKVDARLAKRIAAAQKAEQKRIAEAQKRAEERERENLEKWLQGDEAIGYYQIHNSAVHLRLYKGNVETTKGVSIPLAEARLAFRFIAKHRANGWKRNGEQYNIGGYSLDAINEFGIVAGCHRISWEEIDRFASLMEWNKETVAA